MPVPVKRDDSKLTAVGSTLLYLNKELGLFHYNKLMYLFEYFYIKNFGKRFTKEVFIKYPRGPVIVGYKKHIWGLIKAKIAKGDLSLLREDRRLDDESYIKVRVSSSEQTEQHMFRDETLFSFTKQLSERFASLTTTEIQRVAYDTQPMRAFVGSGWKKGGSYILHAECLRIADHTNALTEGRRKALEHLQKYPEIDYEQQRRLATEFSGLTALRP